MQYILHEKTLSKIVRVDWLGNVANYTKQITMLLSFMLCAQSRLGSFVLGAMLH